MHFRSEEAQHLWWDLAEKLFLKDPTMASAIPGWCDDVVGAWESRRAPPETEPLYVVAPDMTEADKQAVADAKIIFERVQARVATGELDRERGMTNSLRDEIARAREAITAWDAEAGLKMSPGWLRTAPVDTLIRDVRAALARPPEAGGADRRLAARVLELDAALQDAQAEHDAAREALGCYWHPGGSMAEGIAAMRAELKRLADEVSEFCRLWRELESWTRLGRPDLVEIIFTDLRAKAERLSPSPHGQPPSGAPNTDAKAS